MKKLKLLPIYLNNGKQINNNQTQKNINYLIIIFKWEKLQIISIFDLLRNYDTLF